jgi:hypothetical protein
MYILFNYNFAPSSNSNFNEICGIDQRNLWCWLLMKKIETKLQMKVVFPNDLSKINHEDIKLELHVNSCRKVTNKPSLALFMETPAVCPENNFENTKHYNQVITFDENLKHAKNTTITNLPCWSRTQLNIHHSLKNGYVMIAANKSLKSNQHFKDLYLERKKVIAYFARHTDKNFELYGSGWAFPSIFLTNSYLEKIWKNFGFKIPMKCYRGIAESKNAVLKHAEFNFCYENCHYPGYISEKLFDAILNNCVPIYWPSEDTRSILSGDLYIDASKFKNIPELIDFCESMNVSQKRKIREAGIDFLNTTGMDFTHEKFSSNIFKVINKLL